MHELSLCQELLEQVEQLARQHAAVGVSRIVVRIGMLAGVEPELLQSAFAILRPGTSAEHAELVLETIPARIRCRSCGRESECRVNHLLCPICKSTDAVLIAGEEMWLAQIELLQRRADSMLLGDLAGISSPEANRDRTAGSEGASPREGRSS
ncbi:MAG TPA: hydrogenase maturation nickel metallochaperone HypA [Methylococcus sp.]|nr:hydrogenase maturation nickel metallochaperone HypA [Methylococcus sp.]